MELKCDACGCENPLPGICKCRSHTHLIAVAA